MNTFASAVQNQSARTTNGMKARKSTSNACVDLFYKIGASRGKNITPDFVAAMAEDKELALRIALWVRDVRQGAGERQLFRDILLYLEQTDHDAAVALIKKVPALGRFDDLLIFKTPELKTVAFNLLGDHLRQGNGLAAKWMPRKKEVASEIRKHFGMSPKQYRKTLVGLTKVVEQDMCAKNWDEINFSHVPSVAASRYKTAFHRNSPKYAEYVAALVKGTDPKVKVNASSIFPHDVIKGVLNYGSVNTSVDQTVLDLITAQWNALPNYVGDSNVLALVDVSGSMSCPAGGSGSVLCIDVALALGLYMADKNKGVFKDTFLTFSGRPELMHLKGNIVQKLHQMNTSKWDMNTDLVKAMQKILDTAVNHRVPQDQMPDTLMIMSDMQFDRCAKFDDSAMKMIKRKFTDAGYKVPNIVFWNLNAHGNVPVKHNAVGVALVSGFSPAIAAQVLGADPDQFTPEAIMMKTIMDSRYDLV